MKSGQNPLNIELTLVLLADRDYAVKAYDATHNGLVYSIIPSQVRYLVNRLKSRGYVRYNLRMLARIRHLLAGVPTWNHFALEWWEKENVSILNIILFVYLQKIYKMKLAHLLFLFGFITAIVIHENIIFNKLSEFTTARSRWLITFVIKLKSYKDLIKQLEHYVLTAMLKANRIVSVHEKPNSIS